MTLNIIPVRGRAIPMESEAMFGKEWVWPDEDQTYILVLMSCSDLTDLGIEPKKVFGNSCVFLDEDVQIGVRVERG